MHWIILKYSLEKICTGPKHYGAAAQMRIRPKQLWVCAKEIKEQSKTRGARLGLEHTTSWIEEQSADHCDAATCWCKKGRA